MMPWQGPTRHCITQRTLDFHQNWWAGTVSLRESGNKGDLDSGLYECTVAPLASFAHNLGGFLRDRC